MATQDVLNAALLIREAEEALARGTKHYDKAGRELTTVREILEALLREGSVTFVPTEAK